MRTNTPFAPLTWFPKWWRPSNKKDSRTKPSDWKAPRHPFYLPRWMEGRPLGGRDQQKSPRYSYWVLCMLVLPSSDRSIDCFLVSDYGDSAKAPTPLNWLANVAFRQPARVNLRGKTQSRRCQNAPFAQCPLRRLSSPNPTG